VTLVSELNTDVEVADAGCCMMAESVRIMAGEDAVD
jgi:hypothetical protein